MTGDVLRLGLESNEEEESAVAEVGMDELNNEEMWLEAVSAFQDVVKTQGMVGQIRKTQGDQK